MASAAMQQPQPPSPTSTEPPKQDIFLNAVAWVELHRQQLVAGLVGVILLYGVVYLYRHFAEQRELAANAALLEVRVRPNQPDSTPKAADYLKVAEAHATSSAGPRARLLAAGTLFSDNKYSEAMAEFERVLSKPGSPLVAAQAAYGIAASLDALDKSDQAATKYQEIISQYPEDSVAGQARLALARIQEDRKQAAAALKLYDELLKDREQGAFAQQAMRSREQLLKSHPELAPPATGVPVAAGK